MNKIMILGLVSVFLVPFSLEAGSANAKLECKSIKGKIMTLKGKVPGDYAEFNLTFTEDGRSVEMNDKKLGDTVSVVTSWKHHVFTVLVNSKNQRRDLVMYAIPQSVSYKERNEMMRATFRAIVEMAPIPGYKGPVMYSAFHHDIKMKCTWEYST